MRFYTKAHAYYCGIDLHARWMYLCVLDQQGEVLLHRNLRACPEAFLKAIEPFRQDLVVAVECIFTWYWLADLCAQQSIEFVLGHALYMKAIHGGKAKNDRIDSQKIAVLLRGVHESTPGVRELVQATLDLVGGLGLANTITDDAARRRRILDRWARTLDDQMGRVGGSGQGAPAGRRPSRQPGSGW